jgi:hypothetical protein
MKTYTIGELSKNPKRVCANNSPVLVTNNGRPQSLVLNIENFPIDQSINLAQELYGRYCYEQIQQQSIENGLNTITLDEINQEIAAARKSRA